jgi:hypothetical protein
MPWIVTYGVTLEMSNPFEYKILGIIERCKKNCVSDFLETP